MAEKDKEDAAKIERKLKEVYTDGPFAANAKFINLKWTGEPVDSFANEIRRLVGLCDIYSDGSKKLIKLAFVHGFPDSISVELQQLSGIDKMAMGDLIAKAKIFTSTRSTGSASAVANVARRSFDAKPRQTERGGFRGNCFRCEGPHMAKNIPDKKTSSCFSCGKEGHMSYNCPLKLKSSGNE